LRTIGCSERADFKLRVILKQLDEALADYASAPWTVTEFALVESKDGDYLPLRSWPV